MTTITEASPPYIASGRVWYVGAWLPGGAYHLHGIFSSKEKADAYLAATNGKWQYPGVGLVRLDPPLPVLLDPTYKEMKC